MLSFSGDQIWRENRRRPSPVRAADHHLHPAVRRTPWRLLGRHRSAHQPRTDGDVR